MTSTPPRSITTLPPGVTPAPAASELARLPLFRGISPGDLGMLQGVLTQRVLRGGDTLFREGERAREMFVLLQGNVSIYKSLPDGREECLATLVPGAMVGELALIDGLPRSATARVSGVAGGTVLCLGREDFDRLFHANRPFAFMVLDRIVVELSGRLRRATGRLVEATTAETPSVRAAKAREAAASMLGVDLTQLDLGEIDLDAIEVEIAPPERRNRVTHPPF